MSHRFQRQTTARRKYATSHERLSAMVRLDGGTFAMGSEKFYPEEAPIRRVTVDPFWMDRTPVTNAAFAEFVAATGYVSLAETVPDPKLYPGMMPGMAEPGSTLFQRPGPVVDLARPESWWIYTPGACWSRPYGPGSTIEGIEEHPVVHIAYGDAAAYARWAGKSLPTEAEFEFAARGGLNDADYAWGDELTPAGRIMANYWQGRFPSENFCADGWERTSPVGAFPANPYGIYDLIGNVWEWTQDWWSVLREAAPPSSPCCSPRNPRGGTLRESLDPLFPDIRIGRKVLKGGSHLCAENYCQRYRPAARHPEMIDTSTSHIGFRCVVRPDANTARKRPTS